MQEAISVSATQIGAAALQEVKLLSGGIELCAPRDSCGRQPIFKYTYHSNSRSITTLCGFTEGRCESCGNCRAAGISEHISAA